MRHITAAAFGLWVGLAGAVIAAGDTTDTSRPVVVELFTSQGCSSCPPADAMIAGLAPRDDVIALALHVDYWDYIGWSDIFASPAYSDRQRDYAAAAGSRAVYTPQIVVGGEGRVMGAKAGKLGAAIEAAAARPSPVRLTLSRDGAALHVSASADAPLDRAVVVQVVRYIPERMVAIERGENAGKTIHYANIVSDWRKVADWDGTAPISLDLSVEGTEPVVVIVQEKGMGSILAAVRLR
ncbi:MAG: DUF1223 domain-containing protein [Alphaproteobacteria bacterium HGW-Alphaproteobacteria-6]|nr:MAG: DUF1223 domain-containing protein [Alphaproteobacteria bacterium HGW-Alphaproteobacteria-6]